MAQLQSINIAGNVTVSGNTSNTGNCAISQNTTTGNLVITTLTNTSILNVSSTANVVTLNIQGVLSANNSPLSNLATQVVTAICAVKKLATSCTSSTTLTADNSLQVTINENGYYHYELFLPHYATSNGYNGLKWDLASNTAITANQTCFFTGFSNVYLNFSTSENFFITGNQTGKSNCTTVQTQPSYYYSQGSFTVTTPGTIAVRWSQQAASANAVNLMEGSFFKVTKIH